MKTRVASVLALVGVLGAGSAAALVNTDILDDTTESGASAAVLPPAPSVDVPVPPVPEADPSPSSSAPRSTRPTTTAPSSTTSPPTTAPSSLTAFNVGEAGVVTVDIVRGRLVLLGAEPAPGWTVTKSEQDDGGVEVDFESASVRVEFEAALDGGRIVPEVESESLGGPRRSATGSPGAASTAPAPASTAPGSRSGSEQHDDDRDDWYEDDDHDRDDRDEWEDDREDRDEERDDD